MVALQTLAPPPTPNDSRAATAYTKDDSRMRFPDGIEIKLATVSLSIRLALAASLAVSGVGAQGPAPTGAAGTTAAAAPVSVSPGSPAAIVDAASEALSTDTASPRPDSATKSTTEATVRVEVTPGGLTADEVARRAAANNHQLKAKLAQVRAADADVRDARTGFIPSLKLSARYVRLSPTENSTFGDLGSGGLVTTPDPTPRVIDPANEQLFASPPPNLSFAPVLDQYAAGATLSIPLSDYVLRIANVVDAKSRERTAKTLGERAARLSVARDARVAYFEWIRARESLRVARQSVDQATENHDYAASLFGAGMTSRADVLRAHSQVKRAKMQHRRAMTAVDLCVERLRIMLGDAATVRYEVGQDILVDPATLLDVGLTPEVAFDEARQKRAELNMLREQEAALRQAADLIAVDNYPRLDARANVEIVNPNPRRFPQRNEASPLWDVGVMLSWTPTSWFGNSAKAESLIAQAEALVAQRRQMEDGLRQELRVALASLGDASYAVQDARERLLVSEEGYRVRVALFRASQTRLLEVLDADRELTQSRLDVINAYVDLNVAHAQLMHALGRGAS